MQQNKKQLARLFFNIFRIILALSLIYLLFYYEVIEWKKLSVLATSPYMSLLTIGVLILTLPIGAFRWWMLLKSQSYNVQYLSMYHIYAIGGFFNTFFPGSTGGDSIRGIYLLKFITGKKTPALLTVIVDRAIGLHALLALAIVFICINYELFLSNQALMSIGIIISSVFFGVIFLSAGILIISHRLLDRIEKNLENTNGLFYSVLLKIIHAISGYRHHIKTLIICWFISLVLHSIVLSSFVLIANIMEITTLGATNYITAASLAQIANVIPITPGGIGIGEGAFNYICTILSGEHLQQAISYGTIFFAFRILFAMVNLTGSISFMLPKNHMQNKE